MDTADGLLAGIVDAAVHKNKRKDQLRQQNAIFTRELQIALKLTM
jgi:hypothetical protein